MMKNILYLLAAFGIPSIFFVFTISACMGFLSTTKRPIDSKFETIDGIFVFRNTGNWNSNEKVRIYDEMGDVWYEADFTKSNFQYSKDAGPNKIRPFEIEMGDFSPQFRCVRVSSGWYEVIVDEVTSPTTTKYMRRNDSLFEFKTWSGYFRNKEIRIDRNGVFDTPNGNNIDMHLSSDGLVRAVKIDGDWLQISWTEERRSVSGLPTTDQNNLGWVRWRDRDRILISLSWD